MNKTLKLLAVSAFALLIAAPAAFAQSPEFSTLVLTEATEVSGTILQPGTYLVRVVSPQADRNKVQITSVDRSTIYVTALTIPHTLEPNEEIPNSTFVFYPSGEGKPRALRTWFAPNPASGGGHDFIYEEGRARQLARLVNEPVVSYRDEEMADLNVIAPDATVEPYVEPAPVVVTTPAPAPVTVQTEVTTPAPLTTPEPEPAPAPVFEPTPMASSAPEPVEMPETASRIPMLALLGVISLAAAVAIRFARA